VYAERRWDSEGRLRRAEARHVERLRQETARFHREQRIADWRFLKERDRRYKESQASDRAAVAIANELLKEYKANSNEWRGQSKDERATMATRKEMEKELDAIKKDIAMLLRSTSMGEAGSAGAQQWRVDGRAQMALRVATVSSVIAGLSIALVLIRTFLGR